MLITRPTQINLLSMTLSLKIKLLTYGDKSSCLQAAEIGSDYFIGRKLGIVVHLGALRSLHLVLKVLDQNYSFGTRFRSVQSCVCFQAAQLVALSSYKAPVDLISPFKAGSWGSCDWDIKGSRRWTTGRNCRWIRDTLDKTGTSSDYWSLVVDNYLNYIRPRWHCCSCSALWCPEGFSLCDPPSLHQGPE